MDISEVRVKLMADGGREAHRPLAYASLVYGGLVVREVKVIEGERGPFVAFPQRTFCDHCPHCAAKTPVTDRHCGQCGGRLEAGRVPASRDGRRDNWRDVCHPVDTATRAAIQAAVLDAYREALSLGAEWHTHRPQHEEVSCA